MVGCVCSERDGHAMAGTPTGVQLLQLRTCEGLFQSLSPLQLPKKPMSMHYHWPSRLVLVGTLDFQLQAFSHQSQCEVWSCVMKDSVLDITSLASDVFVAIADGTIAKLTVSGCHTLLHTSVPTCVCSSISEAAT